MLDVRRTSDANYGRYMKVLVCGEPGSGKTLFSSTFPNPVVASAEGGLMSLADRNVPYVEIRDSETLLTLKKMLEQVPPVRAKQFGFPVETVVIDTIDEVARIMLGERMKKEHHDVASLQDYGWLKGELNSLVRGLRNLDMHVVFTCHLKSRSEDDGRVKLLPAIEGGFSEQIAGHVDLAFVLKSSPTSKLINNETVRVIERYLQTFPDSNTDWVKDRSGKLAQTVEVTFDGDFDRIAETIYGAVPERAEAPVDKPLGPVAASVLEATEDEATTDVGEPTAPAAAAFTCEECGTSFDDADQADISTLKHRRVLCKTCHTK